MKIGVLGDIHGSIQAFRAEMAALSAEGAELFICTGDIVGIGPFPEECTRFAMEQPGLLCVKGNHDARLFQGTEGLSSPELAHHKWKLSRLSAASLEYLSKLPMELRFTAEGVKLLALHYPHDGEKFRKAVEDIEKPEFFSQFEGYGGDVVIFGHGHKRAIVEKGGVLYLNFGSCGCPHENRGVARGGILQLERGKVSYYDVEAQYDLKEVIDEIDRLKYADFSYIKRVFYGQEQ